MCHGLLLACVNAGDFDLRQQLTMTFFTAIVMTATLFEDDNLLVVEMFYDLCQHFSACADFLSSHQDIGYFDLIAFFAFEFLDGNGVALSDFILFSAGADDSEHRLFSWLN